MNFKYMHPADQLVEIMNRIYKRGMTTTSGGNLSVRDENGDIWITPSGIDKGTLTRSDIMQVKPDGTCIGRHKPSVELPIHSNIYRLRPDIHAVVHAHPPAMVAFSIGRVLPNTRILPDAHRMCGDVALVGYNPPGDDRLGSETAAVFGQGYNSAIMINHGVVCGAKDMPAAFAAFETITTCGQTELDARKLGNVQVLSDAQLAHAAAQAAPEMKPAGERAVSREEQAARRDLCAYAHRCYDQKLFTAAQGSMSVRLSDGAVLITPQGRDRRSIQPADIVWVKNGEADGAPDAGLELHLQIYADHPEVRSVITAQSPSIMAYAVAGQGYDSHTASESFIILGDVSRCDNPALDARQVSAMIGPRRGCVVVDNRCAVVSGSSMANAFDRMEVLEYSAAAAIAACGLGPCVALNDGELQHTVDALGLK